MQQHHNTPSYEGKNSCADDATITYSYATNKNAVTLNSRTETHTSFDARFLIHETARRDAGAVVVLAELAKGQRLKTAATSVTGIALNVTTGMSTAALVEAVKAFGHHAVIHSTFDHGGVETLLDHDKIERWLVRRNHDDVDQDGVVRWLTDVARWDANILKTVEFLDKRQTPDGLKVRVGHAPFPDHRVVFILAKPYIPTDANTHAEGLADFALAVCATARGLGLPDDLKGEAVNPAQLVTVPRCREGADTVAMVIDGPLLDFSKLELAPPVVTPTGKPTFESIKKAIAALPAKATTPDPKPVLEMIARLDNATYRDTLLDALKRGTGGSLPSMRAEVRAIRRAAGDGPNDGVQVDMETGYRTLVHLGDVDHRKAREFILETMETANSKEPAFTVNLGQVMGLKRHKGRASFTPLSARQFQAALFKHCSFAAFRNDDDLTHLTPYGEITGVVLDGIEPGELPEQPTIRRAPTMAPDGRILDRDGLFGDIFVDLGDLTPPKVPTHPTTAEIEAARDLILDDVLFDFKFDDGDAAGVEGNSAASRANAFGLLLTPFLRGAFKGPSPLFCVVKPGSGMGGTLLSETAQMIYDGRTTAPTPNARSEEEMQKVITAGILGDSSFFSFDNVMSLYAEALKRSITAEIIGGRVLGRSELVSRPNDFIWIATGINPRLGAEMTRRSCFINLNTRREFSGDIVYRHPDFKAWLGANRSRIIGALLTLARAWHVAGAKASNDRLDSFQSWAGVIGGVLKTAGVTGFLTNKRAARADREGAEIKAFMGEWWKKFGQADIPEKTAYDHAVDIGAGILTGFADDRRRLFGETLDSLSGRVFNLDHGTVIDRVIVSVGAEGWQLIHLGKLEKTDDADRA